MSGGAGGRGVRDGVRGVRCGGHLGRSKGSRHLGETALGKTAARTLRTPEPLGNSRPAQREAGQQEAGQQQGGQELAAVCADPSGTPAQLRAELRERLQLTPQRRLVLALPSGRLLEDCDEAGAEANLAQAVASPLPVGAA
mmetsp:Transcript_11667/g.31924  ORF Transcript_11667/g.31924 Transcript_11667/m.31924 type:complete len:141 (+) Transcript_11667:365-787(+)